MISVCSGEIGFAIVDESVTKDLPDGDALQRKFEPDTSADKVKPKREFNSNKLSSWNKDLEV